MAGGQEAARAGLKRSESRILTTHAGSLPRPAPLVELQLAASRGEAVEPEVLARASADATRRAVAKQLECGIDIGNDGEQPRESFVTYVRHRLIEAASADVKRIVLPEGAEPRTVAAASIIESRGIADHHFINSIYFRDPNGYVIELTARMPTHAREMDPAKNGAREKLDKWQAAKKQHAPA